MMVGNYQAYSKLLTRDNIKIISMDAFMTHQSMVDFVNIYKENDIIRKMIHIENKSDLWTKCGMNVDYCVVSPSNFLTTFPTMITNNSDHKIFAGFDSKHLLTSVCNRLSQTQKLSCLVQTSDTLASQKQRLIYAKANDTELQKHIIHSMSLGIG